MLIDLVLGPACAPASTLEIEPTDRPDDFVPTRSTWRPRCAGVRAPPRARGGAARRSSARRCSSQVREEPAAARSSTASAATAETGLSGDNPNFNACRFSRSPRAVGRRQHRPSPGRLRRRRSTTTTTRRSTTAGARFSIPIPNRPRAPSASRSRVRAARAETQLRARRAADHPRGAPGGPQPERGPGGHRARPSARVARRGAAARRAASASSTASRRPSTCCCARRSSSSARARRSTAFRVYRDLGHRRSTARQGTILRNRNIDIAAAARRCGKLRASASRGAETSEPVRRARTRDDARDGACETPSAAVRRSASSAATPAPTGAPSAASGTDADQGEDMANIGKSITIKGDLTGNEDLVIEGKVEGKVDAAQQPAHDRRQRHVKAEVQREVGGGDRTRGRQRARHRAHRDPGHRHRGRRRAAPRLVVAEGAVAERLDRDDPEDGAGVARTPHRPGAASAELRRAALRSRRVAQRPLGEPKLARRLRAAPLALRARACAPASSPASWRRARRRTCCRSASAARAGSAWRCRATSRCRR